jgi:hypothetical protein
MSNPAKYVPAELVTGTGIQMVTKNLSAVYPGGISAVYGTGISSKIQSHTLHVSRRLSGPPKMLFIFKPSKKQ